MKQHDFSSLKINEIKQLISKEKGRALREKLITEMISGLSVFMNEIQAKEKFHSELMYLESRALNGDNWDKKGLLTDIKAREQNLLKVFTDKELRANLTKNSYSFNQFGVKLLYTAYHFSGQSYQNQHSLFIDNTYFDKFYTKEVEPENERLIGIKTYLENEKKLIQTKERKQERAELSSKYKEVRTNQNEKITWLKNKQDLVDLFDTLQSYGFIAFKKNKDEILRKHFTWGDGDIGKNDLKHHRNNIKNKSETYHESDEIKLIKDKLTNQKPSK